jgi:hypothetical protein
MTETPLNPDGCAFGVSWCPQIPMMQFFSPCTARGKNGAAAYPISCIFTKKLVLNLAVH